MRVMGYKSASLCAMKATPALCQNMRRQQEQQRTFSKISKGFLLTLAQVTHMPGILLLHTVLALLTLFALLVLLTIWQKRSEPFLTPGPSLVYGLGNRPERVVHGLLQAQHAPADVRHTVPTEQPSKDRQIQKSSVERGVGEAQKSSRSPPPLSRVSKLG